MARPIGIKKVAEMAGVSPGTVSKVLKNYPGISEETRKKVLAVVEKTGFIPNTVASALSTKQNNRIALFIYINDLSQQIDEINMLYILGAFDKAREDNLELITIFNGSVEKLNAEETERYFRSLHAGTIIALGLNKNDHKIHTLAQDKNLNMVVIDAPLEGDNVSTVMVDHEQAQYDVAKEICHERDRVLYLKGKDDGYVTDMRVAGMKRLAEERNLELTIRGGGFSEERAYEIVRNLKESYDAIVCASDLMAIGVKRALPKGSHTRISGFDGIRLMEYVGRGIITCRQDFYRIGWTAVEEAEKLRQGGKGEKVLIPYTLITHKKDFHS